MQRNAVTSLTVAVLSVLVAVAAPGELSSAREQSADSQPSEGAPPDPMSPESLAQDLGPDWYASQDVVFTAEMDENGYHISKAREAEGFAPRHLASIQPGGVADVEWTGYHCVTGSGRSVVAVVAPALAANRPALRDREPSLIGSTLRLARSLRSPLA